MKNILLTVEEKKHFHVFLKECGMKFSTTTNDQGILATYLDDYNMLIEKGDFDTIIKNFSIVKLPEGIGVEIQWYRNPSLNGTPCDSTISDIIGKIEVDCFCRFQKSFEEYLLKNSKDVYSNMAFEEAVTFFHLFSSEKREKIGEIIIKLVSENRDLFKKLFFKTVMYYQGPNGVWREDSKKIKEKFDIWKNIAHLADIKGIPEITNGDTMENQTITKDYYLENLDFSGWNLSGTVFYGSMAYCCFKKAIMENTKILEVSSYMRLPEVMPESAVINKGRDCFSF